MQALANLYRSVINALQTLDWLGPVALRLYLAPVFFVAGMNKLSGFEGVVDWFGNPDWGLGLPMPYLMAVLATATEIGGGILLLLGLGVRLITVPLMATMLVAIFAVHVDHGWQAVADLKSPFASEYTLGIEAEDASEAVKRLDRAKEILRANGDYEWLTEKGNFVVSNSGVEWAATYFVMLLALFFAGAGRVFSVDHWLRKRFE